MSEEGANVRVLSAQLAPAVRAKFARGGEGSAGGAISEGGGGGQQRDHDGRAGRQRALCGGGWRHRVSAAVDRRRRLVGERGRADWARVGEDGGRGQDCEGEHSGERRRRAREWRHRETRVRVRRPRFRASRTRSVPDRMGLIVNLVCRSGQVRLCTFSCTSRSGPLLSPSTMATYNLDFGNCFCHEREGEGQAGWTKGFRQLMWQTPVSRRTTRGNHGRRRLMCARGSREFARRADPLYSLPPTTFTTFTVIDRTERRCLTGNWTCNAVQLRDRLSLMPAVAQYAQIWRP